MRNPTALSVLEPDAPILAWQSYEHIAMQSATTRTHSTWAQRATLCLYSTTAWDEEQALSISGIQRKSVGEFPLRCPWAGSPPDIGVSPRLSPLDVGPATDGVNRTLCPTVLRYNPYQRCWPLDIDDGRGASRLTFITRNHVTVQLGSLV